MNRTLTVGLVGAAAALVSALDAAPAAAQTTFRACRVPSVGAVYMIGVPGAPGACLDASHVEFSWTEGGAPADGSVTTQKLADDAVTSGKILDGSVTAADLAPDVLLEAGVEFGSGLVIDPPLTPTTAASLDVSHPASGYIVAHATGQISCSASQSITLGITNGGNATDGWAFYVPVVGNFAMVHKHEVLSVSDAGTATLNFNVAQQSTDNCTYFRAVNFDAVYVPNRY